MLVAMQGRAPCLICGYRLRFVYTAATERIGKRSLRVRAGLGAGEFWRCPECGSHTGLSPLRFDQLRLDPPSVAAVNAYRLRRWPELAQEGLKEIA